MLSKPVVVSYMVLLFATTLGNTLLHRDVHMKIDIRNYGDIRKYGERAQTSD